jgi:hypothetical protein
MPKLRDTDDLDVEYLDSVEYSTESYSDYAGEVPPIGLELTGYVKRLWWTRTAVKPDGTGDDPMLKVLWIADGNEGDLEEYNGCPFWLNAPLVPGAKFRWDPFLLAYGLTLTEVKTKTYVAKNEDQNGFIIERIGTWKPGAERDEAWARIITGQEPYNGVPQARAAEWIAWDAEETEPEDEAPEDEEPEEEEELEDEAEDEAEEDEEEEEEEEEEADEEPEPPARTRRAATSRRAAPAARASTRAAPAARASRTASKPATAKTGARTRAGAAKPAPARTARATGTRTAKPKAGAAPARSTRTKRKPADNEPPF